MSMMQLNDAFTDASTIMTTQESTLHKRTLLTSIATQIIFSILKNAQRQFLDRIQDMFRWNTSSVCLLIFRS